MDKVKSQRYVDDYEVSWCKLHPIFYPVRICLTPHSHPQGVRVASDGSRFLIRAIVWELYDSSNVRRGAAAFFDSKKVKHL